MKIDDAQRPLLIQALEHYAAYLTATMRNGQPYQELADSLKRKPIEQEDPAPSRSRKAK